MKKPAPVLLDVVTRTIASRVVPLAPPPRVAATAMTMTSSVALPPAIAHVRFCFHHGPAPAISGVCAVESGW
jgi:hypothetical protein